MESPRTKNAMEFDSLRHQTESPRFPFSNQSAKNNGIIQSPRFSKLEESIDSRKTPKFEKSIHSPGTIHQTQFSPRSNQSKTTKSVKKFNNG